MGGYNGFGGKPVNSIFKNLSKPLRATAEMFALPLTGAWIGTGVANIYGFYLHNVIKYTKYLHDVTENTRALETGGTPGIGYMTKDSATERSRMVQALRNTEHGGRRNLGREASLYSSL